MNFGGSIYGESSRKGIESELQVKRRLILWECICRREKGQCSWDRGSGTVEEDDENAKGGKKEMLPYG